MSRARRWLGRLLGSALALSASGLAGCKACDGSATFAAAEQGQLRAIHELGELGDPVIPPPHVYQLKQINEGYAALLPHLESSDPFVRLHAFEALRRLIQRSKPMFRDRHRELLDPVLSGEDPELRWRAAWLLGRLELTRPALHALTKDEDARVAERAVWALGQAKDRDAVEVLLAALERQETRAPAIKALQRTTGERKIETLEGWRAWAQEQPPGPEKPPR